MSVPRFLRSAFPGYEISDVKEFLSSQRIEIHLERGRDLPRLCHRCGQGLSAERRKYRARIEAMPILGLRVFVHFWRGRGDCHQCKKDRAERAALSEGINSVIKMLKRRAFGYRNMEYFRLKIMQVCGYLNSRYVPVPALLGNQLPAKI